MTSFPIHASGVLLFFVLFGYERLKLAEGSTPTAQPTYFPTVPRDEYRQFSLGWHPSMVIDDVTGMYLLIGGNGYDNGGNGKWRKCTDFDKFTCTDIHRQDVYFYADSTLTTRSTDTNAKPSRCNYPRVAQIPNGGDLLIVCDSDDHLIRCPATVNGTNFEGDNCYVYMDSSTTGLSSWNDIQFPTVDKYDNLILADPNTKKVFLCDLGVNPTCSEILDGTSTGLSSMTTCETNKVIFDGGSRAFIGCTNGILEAAVSSHSAGSLTVNFQTLRLKLSYFYTSNVITY